MRAALGAFVAAVLMTGLSASSTAGGGPVVEHDIVVESFDGTPIVVTLMLPSDASAGSPVPIVFMTHDWGGKRERTPGGTLHRLINKGYALLTWDSRGFGESGGEANVASPDFEVKAARALIDWAAKRPEMLLDGPGDPRMGWIGGSNAAGIQFNSAAVDRRIDAIVPIVSWSDLPEDLLPNRVAKQSWDLLLYAGGGVGAALDGYSSPAGPQSGVYARDIHAAAAEMLATGEVNAELRAWFDHKSTVIRSHKVRAPTLIIQGSIDTPFHCKTASTTTGTSPTRGSRSSSLPTAVGTRSLDARIPAATAAIRVVRTNDCRCGSVG